MPSTFSGRSSYPAAGTSSASARCPPAKTTSWPSARSASATASAGTTCPAVPPAAITAFTIAGSCHDLQLGAARGRDVEQQADAREQHDQVRRAVGDERQWHAGERREP